MRRQPKPNRSCSAGMAAQTARRSGSLMVEMVVCTVLLSVVSAVLVPGIFAVHQQRKLTRYDTHALLELNNLADQATAQDPQTLKPSAWFTDRYKDVVLSIFAGDGDDALRPVKLTIVRSAPEGRLDIEHSLTIWLPTDPAVTKEAAE